MSLLVQVGDVYPEEQLNRLPGLSVPGALLETDDYSGNRGNGLNLADVGQIFLAKDINPNTTSHSNTRRSCICSIGLLRSEASHVFKNSGKYGTLKRRLENHNLSSVGCCSPQLASIWRIAMTAKMLYAGTEQGTRTTLPYLYFIIPGEMSRFNFLTFAMTAITVRNSILCNSPTGGGRSWVL